MNKNDYGVLFRFGVSFDMSAYTNLSFTFTKPSGETFTVTGALGVSQITTPEGIFAADTYATYVFQDGEVDEAGDWSCRLTYRDSSPAQYISSIGYFTVGE